MLQYESANKILTPPDILTFRSSSSKFHFFFDLIGFCNATWDGFLCWPLTPADQVASQLCPENVKGILRGRKFNTLKASVLFKNLFSKHISLIRTDYSNSVVLF